MLCENRHPYHSYHNLKPWDFAERLQLNKKEGTGFVLMSLLHRHGVCFCVRTCLPCGLYLILRREGGAPWWCCYPPTDSLIGMRSRSRLWRWQAESHPPSQFSSGHTRTHAPLHPPTRSRSRMLICEIHAHIHLFSQVSCCAHYEILSSSAPKLILWSGQVFCAYVWNACCDLVCIQVAKCHFVHMNHEGRGLAVRRRGQSPPAGESRH